MNPYHEELKVKYYNPVATIFLVILVMTLVGLGTVC